jgi:hypothetical protein
MAPHKFQHRKTDDMMKYLLAFILALPMVAQVSDTTIIVLPTTNSSGAPSATGQLQFRDLSTPPYYEGFQAYSALTKNLIWVLPSTDAAGCLVSDGSFHLSWSSSCTGSGGSGPWSLDANNNIHPTSGSYTVKSLTFTDQTPTTGSFTMMINAGAGQSTADLVDITGTSGFGYISSTAGIGWKDTASNKILNISFDGSNNLNLGPQSNPASNGEINFYAEGGHGMTFSHSIGGGTYALTPTADATLQLGGIGSALLSGAIYNLTLPSKSGHIGTLLLQSQDFTSNYISISAGTAVTGYALEFPNTLGAAGQALTIISGSQLGWSSPGLCSDCMTTDTAQTATTAAIKTWTSVENFAASIILGYMSGSTFTTNWSFDASIGNELFIRDSSANARVILNNFGTAGGWQFYTPTLIASATNGSNVDAVIAGYPSGSSDILDVDLTIGGTKELFVDSSGGTHIANCVSGCGVTYTGTSPISVSGTSISCPTCLTTAGGQTITGPDVFNSILEDSSASYDAFYAPSGGFASGVTGSLGAFSVGGTTVIDGSRDGIFVALSSTGQYSNTDVSTTAINDAGGLNLNSGLGLSSGASVVSIHGTTLVDASGNVTAYTLSVLPISGSSTNHVGFRGPSTISANVFWTLPATDSTGTGCLASNGGGTLSWITCTGGVASVTASSPIVSSGGTAPNISCPTCITTAGGQTISGNLTLTGTLAANILENSTLTFGVSNTGAVTAASLSVSGAGNISTGTGSITTGGSIAAASISAVTSVAAASLNASTSATAPTVNATTNFCAAGGVCGQTVTVTFPAPGFTIGGTTFHTLTFTEGILTGHS